MQQKEKEKEIYIHIYTRTVSLQAVTHQEAIGTDLQQRMLKLNEDLCNQFSTVSVLWGPAWRNKSRQP